MTKKHENSSVKIKKRPLEITSVAIPGIKGLIGICSCPGLKDEPTRFDLNGESLIADLVTIHNWGAAALVSLLDESEFSTLGMKELPKKAKQLGMTWFHLPIRNMGLPDITFEEHWAVAGPILHHFLHEGKRVVVHCKGDIGRSGLISARLLIELGIPPVRAINLVQLAHPGSLRLQIHEDYCYSLDSDR
jgi:ADP-ribosyl-[dinitrogen reductase] hydrolase